jgi:hypothetical protein
VDFILESEKELVLIEAKYQSKFRGEFEEGLLRLEALIEENPKLRKKFKKIQKILVYAGDLEQKTASGTWVLPLQAFLERVVAG